MENGISERDQHRDACAQVAGLFSEPWLRCYVWWKLRSDEIYSAAYALLHSRSEPILDIGCGVGLLAFYLRARGCVQPINGVDRDARKIRRAAGIIAGCDYKDVYFRHAAITEVPADFRGDIVLFDVLHYLAEADQQSLLASVAQHAGRTGTVILRDAPRERRGRFYATYGAEKFAQMISWNVGTPLRFASSAEIKTPFRPDEFTHEERPMWQNTPFNNRLFIFRRRCA